MQALTAPTRCAQGAAAAPRRGRVAFRAGPLLHLGGVRAHGTEPSRGSDQPSEGGRGDPKPEGVEPPIADGEGQGAQLPPAGGASASCRLALPSAFHTMAPSGLGTERKPSAPLLKQWNFPFTLCSMKDITPEAQPTGGQKDAGGSRGAGFGGGQEEGRAAAEKETPQRGRD